ncbi:MAG TPA: AI-2E family transporter [Nevskiales bacterium]|nr:AI-2E family transporter [Nevskiales bacterium]
MNGFLLKNRWAWAAIGLALLVLVYLLGRVLTPFVIAAGLAYLGDPVVQRLQRLRLSRTLAVTLVFVTLYAGGIVLAILLFPPLERQLGQLLQNLPDYLLWLQRVLLPWLERLLPEGYTLDAATVKAVFAQHWTKAGGLVPGFLQTVSQSGMTLLALVGNAVLIPVITFYLMRDWHAFVQRVRELVPQHLQPTVNGLAREFDDVLGAFVRGQLLVMLSLAVYYSIALALCGLKLALLVGVITGLVSFVPYLGFIIGVILASAAMLVQEQSLMALLPVAVVFTFGQLLESYLFTPRLVGNRIGLHPVAVIFAVLAGGQLFGFVGVLLALPAAAVIAVLLRHLRRQWVASDLYQKG